MEKKTKDNLLKTIALSCICCLSVVWGVYGVPLLTDLKLESFLVEHGWLVVLLLSAICVVGLFLRISQKRGWKKFLAIIAAICLLMLVPLLTLGFRWQELLTGLILGIALMILVWPCLPKQHTVPSEPEEDEMLGRKHMYHLFWTRIYNDAQAHNGGEEKSGEKRRGLCIAVSGDWGSGKSHFISHTIYEFDCMGTDAHGHKGTSSYRGQFRTASVDLWESSSVEEMWCEIANALAYTARGYRSDCFLGNKLVKSVFQLCHLPLPLADETAKLLSFVGNGENLIKSRIYQEISESVYFSLLVLDNIERCSVNRLRTLFPVIESLARIPRLVILCGVAKGKMAAVMGREAPDLCSALMKICDDDIHIPLIASTEGETYLSEMRKKEKEKPIARLDKWFDENGFDDMSPRLAKKIRVHLCQFSKMFHRFLTQPAWDDDFDIEELCQSIFNFEAIRIAFPDFPLPVRDWDPDRDVRNEGGESQCKDEKVSTDDSPDNGSAFKKWRAYIRQRYGMVMYGEDEPTRHGLYRLATSLSHASDACLALLHDREYTSLVRLTYDEYELCLRKISDFVDILKDKGAGANKINSIIEGACVVAKYMPIVLQYMYDHCVSKSCLLQSLKFMKALYQEELHHEQSFFALDYATVLIRLGASFHEMEYFCQNILPSYGFEALSEIADIILTCIDDKHAWNYDYIFGGRKVLWETRMMLQAFHEKWEEPPHKTVLDAVLKEYAAKACESILTYDGKMVYSYYKNLILGKSNAPKCYRGALARGAKDYLSSLKNNGERKTTPHQLLKVVTVMDSFGGERVPFAVLSFAVIWKILYKGLDFSEKADSNKITECVSLIEVWKDRDKKLSKKERDAKGGTQFWENREMAMDILLNTLKGQ